MMKNITEVYAKYKLLIWPILSGIASVVILVLVIIPQLLTYLNIRGQISDIVSRSGKLEVKAQSLDAIDENLSEANLKLAFAVLPADRNVPSAVTILQSLITQSGLTLKSTSYSAAARGASKDSYQLNVTVLGQISNVRNFLMGLRDSGRVFQVESINVQFQKSGSLVEAEIPITVFYGLALGKVGALEQEPPKLSEKEEKLLVDLSLLANNPKILAVTGEASASSVPIGKSNPFE